MVIFADMKGVNIFLADGFEDVEALGTRDVLLRGGLDVRLVSIGEGYPVRSSHSLEVRADALMSEIDLLEEGTLSGDVMIFPGGMPGSRNLASCRPLIDAMNAHYAGGGTVAAICAAPGLVLGQLESAPEGTRFTCFDSFEKYCPSSWTFDPRPAVRSGRIITGRSAGHALSFGLEILSFLKGEDAAAKVAHDLYL